MNAELIELLAYLIGSGDALALAEDRKKAAAALRKLAEQKPAAWLYRLTSGRVEIIDRQLDHYYPAPGGGYIKGEPLYAAPVPTFEESRDSNRPLPLPQHLRIDDDPVPSFDVDEAMRLHDEVVKLAVTGPCMNEFKARAALQDYLKGQR